MKIWVFVFGRLSNFSLFRPFIGYSVNYFNLLTCETDTPPRSGSNTHTRRTFNIV